MSSETGSGHAPPAWFTAPGETDYVAWFVVVLIILALFGVITLHAAFDRWAEHKSSGTPLARTISTLLVIALLYEIFPLDHFSVLLPISAVLLALVADWSRFHLTGAHRAAAQAAPADPPATGEDPPAASKRAENA